MNPRQSPPTSVRWLICGLACVTSLLLYLHRYSWGIVRPAFRVENPELSEKEMGWIDGVFFASYAVGQIPGGLVGDRFGPRGTLTLMALVWSLTAAGVSWTTGLWGALAARSVFGLAQAGVYPVLNRMTRSWFPLTSRTSVQGAVSAMGRVGGAFAPIIIATLLMDRVGLSWQTTLLVISAPGIVLAIVLWCTVRDNPREHPWTNQAERDLVEGKSATEPDNTAFQAGMPPLAADSIREGPPPARPVLHLTAASLFSLAMMLLYIAFSTFQDQFYVNLLPSFLMEAHGFDLGQTGLYTALPLLGGAAGGIIGGMLNDLLIRSWGNRRWARSLVALTGKSVAAGMVLVSLQMADGRAALLALVAARVFSDWSMPTQWAAITDMGGRAAATLFGIINTVGALGGSIAGPVFGILKASHGWDGVLVGVAVMCLLAATTWLFIDCTQRLVGD
jgi:sugar phosphate permease